MSTLPSGTISIAFTDIQGSTRLWEQHPKAMQAAVEQHDAIMRQWIEALGGAVFKTAGDAFFAAFHTAPDAIEAMLGVQRALAATDWGETPIRVRMALHTGAVQARDGDYFGPPLNRCARLLSAAHGGQVLLSAVSHELVRDHLPDGARLRDLGEHRLRDLERPERVYQLEHSELAAEFPALQTLDSVPNNLPVQLTSFVGREQAMADLRSLLERTRLLTVTGTGGTGKTRLALQLGADLLDRFPDGVWLVELGELAEPSLVPFALADVLGLREEPGRPLVRSLVEHIGKRQLLILLDNCEHLADAAASLAQQLLKACPGARVLATSRERLAIQGETVWTLPALDLPDVAGPARAERLIPFAAVQLFIDRALAARPDFQVDNRSAPALAQFCHRLDGIPLAIELAAARAKVLSVEQILARLDDRFRLLAGRGRSGLPHHQTLRAAIDWSHELLDEGEQAVLRRLSVFRGGWSLEAAEQVCAEADIESYAVLDYMGQLLDKSLLTAEQDEGDTRYAMLGTIRDYAAEKLVSAGESGSAQHRHLQHFAEMGEAAAPELGGSEQLHWLERLGADHENLRAGLDFARREEQAAAAGLGLAAALSQFWRLRGHLSEGRDWLGALLDVPANAALTAARAAALDGAGVLAFAQGDLANARRLAEEALGISRALRDQPLVAQVLRNLGNVADQQADYATAERHYAESSALWTELGDRWGAAAVQNNLGLLQLRQGHFEQAREQLQEALANFESLDVPWAVGITLSNLADVAHDQGDLVEAGRRFEQSLAIARRLGDREGIAYALVGLACVARREDDTPTARGYLEEASTHLVELGDKARIAEWLEAAAQLAAAEGESARAAMLIGAAEALREQIDAPLPLKDQPERERLLGRVRDVLGEDATLRQLEVGRAMGWEQIMMEAAG